MIYTNRSRTIINRNKEWTQLEITESPHHQRASLELWKIERNLNKKKSSRPKERGGEGRKGRGRGYPQGALRCLLDWWTAPTPPRSEPSRPSNCQPPGAAGSPYGLRTQASSPSLFCFLVSPPLTPSPARKRFIDCLRKEERCANPLR